jgi:hypothetical protein
MSSSSNNPPWQANIVNPSTGPPIREEQVTQAVRFLADSRTKSASQQEKESFLRQKGLTDSEIAAAISRSNPQTTQGLATSTALRPIYIPPPVIEEPIIWSALKSIFGAFGAMAIGVIGYHLYRDSKPDNEKTEPSSDKWTSNVTNNESATEERIDKLAASIEAMKVEQALRHKELLVSIRELTSSQTCNTRRKPGGSVVMHDTCESASSLEMGSDQMQQSRESINISSEIASAIASGTDTSLQLILSSVDKKLNKSNPRFKKFQGNKILQYVGFIEDDEFIRVPIDKIESARGVASDIIEEMKRQRANKDESVVCKIDAEKHPTTRDDKDEVAESEEGSHGEHPVPPWLVPASQTETKHVV